MSTDFKNRFEIWINISSLIFQIVLFLTR